MLAATSDLICVYTHAITNIYHVYILKRKTADLCQKRDLNGKSATGISNNSPYISHTDEIHIATSRHCFSMKNRGVFSLFVRLWKVVRQDVDTCHVLFTDTSNIMVNFWNDNSWTFYVIWVKRLKTCHHGTTMVKIEFMFCEVHYSFPMQLIKLAMIASCTILLNFLFPTNNFGYFDWSL